MRMRRGPSRGMSRGTMREMVKIERVIGRKAMPVTTGLKPITRWRNCVRKKKLPYIAATVKTTLQNALTRLRLASKCKGMMGCSCRVSISTKVARMAAAKTIDQPVPASFQPFEPARMKA